MGCSINTITMVHAFIETLPPNVDRDRLAAELERAATYYDTVRRRGSRIRERLNAIATALPDASEQERAALVTERMERGSDLLALPLDTTVAARRYGTAQTAWVQFVYPEIVREQARAAEAADALAAKMRPLRTKLAQWDQSSRLLAEHREEHAAMWTHLRALSAEWAPCEARAHEARNVASSVLNGLRDQFGSDFGSPDSVTREHVEKFAAMRAKAA